MSVPRTARVAMPDRDAELRPWPPERKLRLFACACCRRSWERLAPACRAAVVAAERRADGSAGAGELQAAWRAARLWERSARVGEPYLETIHVHRVAAAVFTPADADAVVADLRPWRGDSIDNGAADEAHRLLYADVCGAPPGVFDPRWRTPAVLELAERVYRERCFGVLPELADRLAGAGCGERLLLAHLRDLGPHSRGCWALDRVLGLG
jgi:hypothetical protein